MGKILKYVVLSSLIPAVILAFLFYLNPAYVFTSAHYSIISAVFKGYVNPFSIFLGIIIFAVITLFVKTIFLQIFSVLLKGKGKFEDTFNAVGIALIPFLIFGWIPILNIWAFFYGLTLLVYGLALKQKFSISRAAVALAISVIILLLVLISILPLSLLIFK